MPKAAKSAKRNGTTANLGFEQKLWQAAAALRNNMNAAEYWRTRPSTTATHLANCLREAPH